MIATKKQVNELTGKLDSALYRIGRLEEELFKIRLSEAIEKALKTDKHCFEYITIPIPKSLASNYSDTSEVIRSVSEQYNFWRYTRQQSPFGNASLILPASWVERVGDCVRVPYVGKDFNKKVSKKK